MIRLRSIVPPKPPRKSRRFTIPPIELWGIADCNELLRWRAIPWKIFAPSAEWRCSISREARCTECLHGLVWRYTSGAFLANRRERRPFFSAVGATSGGWLVKSRIKMDDFTVATLCSPRESPPLDDDSRWWYVFIKETHSPWFRWEARSTVRVR